MQAAFLQYNPRYLETAKNLDTVEKLLDRGDLDLLVLPELFASGYFFHHAEDLKKVAEPIPDGPTTQRLLQWASDLQCTIVAGLPEIDQGAIYNSAVVVSPQGVLGIYRKVHLFYEEKTLFEPGNLGFKVFDVTDKQGNPYRLGVMICFDWYFPEATRSLALQGADVIAHPANLVRPDCPRSMPIRALENHLFTVTANRYGTETRGETSLTFIGQSEICDPSGTILIQADRTSDCLGVAAIEPHLARNKQINVFNHLLNDRRPSVYTTAIQETQY